MKSKGWGVKGGVFLILLMLTGGGLFAVEPINSFSVIYFADVNNDSLQDLLISNNRTIRAYLNRGTASAPSYGSADYDLPMDANAYRVIGSFADIFYSGKMDVFFGAEAGGIGRIANTGTASNPVWTTVRNTGLRTNSFLGITHDPFIETVLFHDFDSDGDLDLIFTDPYSFLTYYVNQDRESDGWVDGKWSGTTTPSFTVLVSWSPLVGCGATSAKPALLDWTADGLFDLYAGDNFSGGVRSYVNSGTLTRPSLTSAGIVLTDVVTGLYPTCAFRDFTGDGFLDLYYGNAAGAFTLVSSVNRSSTDVDVLPPPMPVSGLTKDSLEAGGLTLKWPFVNDAAVTSGSKYRSGVYSYALYRDDTGDSDFTPSQNNLLWKHYQWHYSPDYAPEFADGDGFKIVNNYFYYHDAGLSGGNTYCYKLVVTDAAGNSVTTDAVCQTFDPPYFDSVSVQVSPLVTTNAFLLSFSTLDQYANLYPIEPNGTEPNISVQVYKGTPPAPSGETLVDAVSSEPVASMTFDGTSNYTGTVTIADSSCEQFYVHVTAVHNATTALITKEKLSSQVIIDRAAPPMPTLTGTPQGYSSIVFSWTPVTDNCSLIARYRLFIKGPTDTAYSQQYSGTLTSYTKTVLPCQSYRAYVTAVDTAGNETVVASPDAVAGTYAALPDTTAPNNPTGLTGTYYSSDTKIQLNWNDVADSQSGLYRYEIQKHLTGAEYAFLCYVTYSEHSDNQTNPGTPVYYRVRAIDKCNNASGWTEVSVTKIVDTTAPTVPTGLAGSALSPSSIGLTWNASTDSGSGVRGYNIYLNSSSTPFVEAPTNSYTHTGLTANTSYTYQVAAVDNVGNVSAKTSAISVRTLPSTSEKPNPPTDLRTSLVEASRVTLRWTAPTARVPVSSYRVYRHASATSADSSGVLVGSSTTTEYTVTGLTAATTYYYTVKSVSSTSVESNPSNRLAVTTASVATPTVPQNFRVTDIGSNTVDLAWSASTPSAGVVYSICIGRDTLFGPACIQTAVTTTNLSIQITGLSPSHEYIFLISAQLPGGVSSDFNKLETTTLVADTTPPSAPTNLTGVALSKTSIQLTWTASSDGEGSGIDHYRIYRNGAYYLNVTDTTFTDLGLQAGTTYSYGVEAVDNADLISDRATVDVTTLSDDTTGPSTPGNFTAVVLTGSSVALSWGASTDNEGGSGLDGYEIYRNGVLLIQVEGLSHVDTGLTSGTDYSYYVMAIDEMDNRSPASNTVTVRPQDLHVLYVGHVCESDLWFSRLTIVNVGATDNPIDVYAYNHDGTQLEKVTLPSLPTHAKFESDLATLFSPAVFQAGNDVWLKIESVSEIQGVASFGTKDNQGMTALPLFGVSATDLVFPYVYIDNIWMTGLTVINTGQETAGVTFRAFSEIGELLSTVNAELPVNNKSAKLIDQLFPEVENPSRIRFVKADSTQPLIGFEAFGSLAQPGWSSLPCFSLSKDLFKFSSSDQGEQGREAIVQAIPSTPTGLTAQAVSSDKVLLSWNKNPEEDIDHYEVLNNDSFMAVLVGTASGTSYTVSGLTAESTHKYSIKAVNTSAQTSEATAQVSVVTLPTGQVAYPYKAYFNEIPDPSFYGLGVTFSNIGTDVTEMKLDLYNKEGVRIGEKLVPSVAPNAQVSYEIRYFFDNVLPEGAAYMTIGSLQPVLGFEIFLTADTNAHPFQMEGINIVKKGVHRMNFPMLINTADWTSICKLTNTETAEASVTVTGYGQDGVSKGDVVLTIPALGKVERSLAELFPSITDLAWFTVYSEKELIGDMFIVSADATRLISYLGMAQDTE